MRALGDASIGAGSSRCGGGFRPGGEEKKIGRERVGDSDLDYCCRGKKVGQKSVFFWDSGKTKKDDKLTITLINFNSFIIFLNI